MANGALQALEELRQDAKLNKDRHFAAADRKHHHHIKFGLPVVLINLFIGSVLASSLAKEHANPLWLATVATFLSFVAASLSGVQTFFNFHRMAEGHRSIANRYLSIAARCKNIIQRHHDDPLEIGELWQQIADLRTEYDQVNRDAEGYPTAPEDFEAAKKRSSVTPFVPAGVKQTPATPVVPGEARIETTSSELAAR